MLLVFSTYSSSFPAVGPDKQSSGYSKLFLHMPHHVDSAISLPRLPADLVDQWQADSTPFTLAVNTAIPLAGQMMSYETFCESAPDSGHLLIDLFGWSKQQCQSAMLHYKLLKLQNLAVSAHLIVPAVRHIYDHGTYKPSRLMNWMTSKSCTPFDEELCRNDALDAANKDRPPARWVGLTVNAASVVTPAPATFMFAKRICRPPPVLLTRVPRPSRPPSTTCCRSVSYLHHQLARSECLRHLMEVVRGV